MNPITPAAGKARRRASGNQISLLTRASILVPAHNAAPTIRACLEPLVRCAALGAEVIVCNDRSTDETLEIVRQFPAVRLANLGVANGEGEARNIAARVATREFLVYVDSDVVVEPTQIEALLRHLDEGGWDAAVGCYSERHPHQALVSQYKNLWIRMTYLAGPRELEWLWTACCAIERRAFFAVGGFNTKFSTAHGGIDFEMGARLRKSGRRILFDSRIECQHLKRFNLPRLLLNDHRRGRGYTMFALSQRSHGLVADRRFANVRLSHFLSGCLATALPVLAVLAAWRPWGRPLLFAALLLWGAFQVRFVAYFGARRGPLAALAAVPILFLDQMASLLGVLRGVFAYMRGERAPHGAGFEMGTLPE